MLSGGRALAYCSQVMEQNTPVSRFVSATPLATAAAVERLQQEAAAPLKDASLVVAQYPLGGGYKGYIGIIGPTRMNYSQIAARLEYFAKGLGALIRDVMSDGKDSENSTDGRDE